MVRHINGVLAIEVAFHESVSGVLEKSYACQLILTELDVSFCIVCSVL